MPTEEASVPDLTVHHHLGYDPIAANMLQRVGGKGPLGPVVHDGTHTWRVIRTTEGPGTVRIRPTAEGADVDAWGPGASIAASMVPDLLGASDDPTQLVPQHDVVRAVVKRRRFDRMTRTNTVWEHLVPTILGQKVPTAAAARSWRGMLLRWGTEAPGPAPERLRLGPEPDVLAGLAYHEFHRFDVERKRAQIIINAAQRANRLEEAVSMAPDEARRRLEALPGIGPWTSSIVSQLALGDPDAVIIGDYNLPNTVAWTLARERHGDDARMLELLEPYRGQRARVQSLLKFSGDRRERRGPKLSLADLSGR